MYLSIDKTRIQIPQHMNQIESIIKYMYISMKYIKREDFNKHNITSLFH